MRAGTAMDPFPESYPNDPMANVREAEPPKDPNEEEPTPIGDESESEDLNTEPDPDEDSEIDAEAGAAQ